MPELIQSMSIIPERNAEQKAKADKIYQQSLLDFYQKIVVLDDDPTGIQTVHDVDVFTHWDQSDIDEGFLQEKSMFYILTNSRSMSEEETKSLHNTIAERVLLSARKTGKDFVLISRGDSTLRGHFPTETEALKATIEHKSDLRFDGEIICPFFPEGGRYTLDSIHYVKDGVTLIPSAQTEFAKDATFGYRHSNLLDWVEEKTQGAWPASSVQSIPLNWLLDGRSDLVSERLLDTNGFAKIVVNAVSYDDIKVFVAGYIDAVKKGKRFIFRSAAAIPKILGGIPDRGLLNKRDLITNSNNGGLVIVGSHVGKTTRQLDILFNRNPGIVSLEFNVAQVLVENGLDEETRRLVIQVEDALIKGRTVCVYTSRDYLELSGNKEEKLRQSVRISDAVTNIVKLLSIKPSFILAKGGITSSDIGVNGLSVRKAHVMGQVAPGIPVWMTDKESKYGHMPYIIFPGNVGQDETLAEIVEKLM